MYPLNWHFLAAGVREKGAEMTQTQRNAPVYLPRAEFAVCAAAVREKSAENAT